LNGTALALAPIHNGFVKIERVFHPGDRLTLTLPMQVKTSQWPDGGIGIEHGPLVYSLPVQESWTSVVTAKWSSPEFPQWNAVPASSWNYAIALDNSRNDFGLVPQRQPMTTDPWLEPPIKITTPAKKVPGWELHSDGDHPERLKTPPLPVLAEEGPNLLAGVAVERVTLVPYGATHLRLTIFPKA
jgi:hypothetical protein